MIQFMKMLKGKSEVKPILLKVGMALTLSVSVFIYSRYGTRRSKPPPRLPKPGSADHSRAAVAGEQIVRHVDGHALKKTSSSCRIVSNLKENHEEKRIQTMTLDTFPAGPLSSSKQGAEKDRLLLPELDEIVRDLDLVATSAGKFSGKYVKADKLDADGSTACVSHEKDNEQEILNLKNRFRVLKERERRLEIQLLECYGLKQQEAAMIELQNQLERASMEGKILSFKIDSLQSENRRLEAQLNDHARVVSELDAAQAKIRVLKKKLRNEAELSKEHILKLKVKVSQLQDQEINAGSYNQETQIRLQRLKDLETEACDLREANLRLQEEKSYVTEKLESTQVLANSLLEDPWKRDSERLRQENEGLAKQIEQLQSDHCSGIEELVYLRWINACLRYELRNYQVSPGKTVARELSNSLSPKSENKVKQMIVEYAIGQGIDGKRGSSMDFDSEYWSSSQVSSLAHSGELDDPSADFSSSKKNNNSSKAKFFSKLRKLVRRKEGGNYDSYKERIESLEESTSSFSTANDTEVECHRDGSTSSSQSASGSDFQYLRSMSMRQGSMESKNRNIGGSHVMRGRGYSADFRRSLDLPRESSEKSELLKYAQILKASSGSASSHFPMNSSYGSS